MLANHHLYYRLARLTAAFKIIAIDFFSAVFYQVSLEVHQTIYICVGSFSFAKSQQAISKV